jgi:hypothetical protein
MLWRHPVRAESEKYNSLTTLTMLRVEEVVTMDKTREVHCYPSAVSWMRFHKILSSHTFCHTTMMTSTTWTRVMSTILAPIRTPFFHLQSRSSRKTRTERFRMACFLDDVSMAPATATAGHSYGSMRARSSAITEMHGAYCGNRPMRISTATPNNQSGAQQVAQVP